MRLGTLGRTNTTKQPAEETHIVQTLSQKEGEVGQAIQGCGNSNQN